MMKTTMKVVNKMEETVVVVKSTQITVQDFDDGNNNEDYESDDRNGSTYLCYYYILPQ